MALTFPRRITVVVTVLAAALGFMLTVGSAPAVADPEDGGKALQDALESAAKGQAEAQRLLTASRRRQVQLQETIRRAQAAAQGLQGQVAVIADRSYRTGRPGVFAVLLESRSPDAFLERAIHLDMMAQLDGHILARYRADLDQARQAKAAVDVEVREQQRQVTTLTRKRREAELALGSVGGGGAAGGFVDAGSAAARPAPRNSDGSWPSESCTVDDPTSGGCITPRLLNAYQQARAAGFGRYTVCWSQRSSGEHPKGRACDFSVDESTFRDAAATGSDKAYGNRLAAFFVHNADRLGVLYVIWYRQIWLPGSGWKTYHRSGGPSVVHTNHVHLSVL